MRATFPFRNVYFGPDFPPFSSVIPPHASPAMIACVLASSKVSYESLCPFSSLRYLLKYVPAMGPVHFCPLFDERIVYLGCRFGLSL